jgi:uncharacterized protein (DUF302 family)
MKMLYAAMLTLVLSVPAAPVAQAADGLVQKLSAHSVQTTMDSLEKMLPTQLLMFGNPAIGTNLMTSQRTVGVDLPIKVLIWEEPDGKVWIAYNDPAYLAERHDIGDRDEVLAKMGRAVKGLVSAAASP